MIYVIDHNDSFTHNVVHQFSLFDSVECDQYSEINEKKLINIICHSSISLGAIF